MNSQSESNIVRQAFQEAFKSNQDTQENQELFHQLLAEQYQHINDESISNLLDELNDGQQNPKLELVKSALQQILHNFTIRKPLHMDAIFFPSEDESKVSYYLGLATKTLDICIFILSNDYLAWQIYDLHKKGVKIRIITDDEQLKSYGSDVQDLSDAGIPCRTDSNKVAHMHHKFCIIDSFILMNGSFNWTSQAVDQNQENLTVIENHELCNKYQEQFDKLWADFEKQELACSGNDPFLTRKRPTWREKQKKKQNNEKNDGAKKDPPKRFYYRKK